MRADLKQISTATGLLVLFAIGGALALALTDLGTRDAIAENERQQVLRQLAAVMPPASYDNDPLLDVILVTDPLLVTNRPSTIYRARLGNQAAGVAIETVAPNGYNGNIRMLVGINANGTVTGVRVIAHKETPGLGDKIDEAKSDWIDGFTGKSLRDPKQGQWSVNKDGGAFDSFTGATITPRAVISAVANALRWFRQERDTLFARPAESTTDSQDVK